jgi:membrane associated rhomboid family serine protease
MWTWLKSVFGGLTPVVRATLLTLIAVFILSAIGVQASGGGARIYDALALRPSAVIHQGRVWTLLTYALLHDLTSTWHLIFNCLVFYFFGSTMESRWGSKRMLIFVILTALGGGLFVMGSYFIGLGDPSVVGASAIGTGLIIAFGLAYPDRQVILLFFPVKALHLVYITIALEVLGALSLSNVSSAAHFGGMFAGYLLCDASPLRRAYLNWRLRQLQGRAETLRSRSARRAGPPLRVIPGGQKAPPKDKRWLN